MGSDYVDREAAARMWLRAAKQRGIVTVLGGGWWKIAGWDRPVQGISALAGRLQQRGFIMRLPGGRVRLELAERRCEACGSVKPAGQSCGCFDNGGQ